MTASDRLIVAALLLVSVTTACAPSTAPAASTVAAVDTVTAIGHDEFVREIPGLRRPQDTNVVVVVGQKDCFTCENLGHQLRELIGRSRYKVIVMARAADSARVGRFLRQERILPDQLVIPAKAIRLQNGGRVATPAAFIVVQGKIVLRAVMHVSRVSGVRAVSFADELSFMDRSASPP